jgi:hypothetical protein
MIKYFLEKEGLLMYTDCSICDDLLVATDSGVVMPYAKERQKSC